jgi:hypothetical protein
VWYVSLPAWHERSWFSIRQLGADVFNTKQWLWGLVLDSVHVIKYIKKNAS